MRHMPSYMSEAIDFLDLIFKIFAHPALYFFTLKKWNYFLANHLWYYILCYNNSYMNLDHMILKGSIGIEIMGLHKPL